MRGKISFEKFSMMMIEYLSSKTWTASWLNKWCLFQRKSTLSSSLGSQTTFIFPPVRCSPTWPSSTLGYQFLLSIITIIVTMDKLKLAGRNLGWLFNFKNGHLHVAQVWWYQPKRPNLMLETWPKELLFSLPLDVTLPDLAQLSVTNACLV
jgi:hypothetical protein